MTATVADIDQFDPTTTRAGRAPHDEAPSRRAIRASYVVSGFAVLFLAMDIAMKLMQAAPAVEGTAQLGYPTGILVPLGVVELAALILYLVPRTAVLGALIWTGYLGGAVATHVRMGHPLFSHTLFPIYFAALLWGGLWLRDRRVRALFA